MVRRILPGIVKRPMTGSQRSRVQSFSPADVQRVLAERGRSVTTKGFLCSSCVAVEDLFAQWYISFHSPHPHYEAPKDSAVGDGRFLTGDKHARHVKVDKPLNISAGGAGVSRS